MEKLEHEKTEKSKKRRIILKVERTKYAQRRKEWSRKHGHDTYGDDEDIREFDSCYRFSLV
jgi:hypothetical protein